MLWIFGSFVVALWFVARFLLHKGGMVHVLLIVAAACFIIQFAQDCRTRAYDRSVNR